MENSKDYKAAAEPPLDCLVGQLASAMAGKTDAILREAVTRFLGREDWTDSELKGRMVRQVLPSGVEYFCMDGVALVELYPLTIADEIKNGSVVFTTTQNYRFLVPNASNERPASAGPLD